MLISEHWPNMIEGTKKDQAKLFEKSILAIKAKADSEMALAAAKRELKLKKNHQQILQNKLANKAFVENAPAALVEAEQAKLESVTMELQELAKTIDTLQDSSSS